MNAITGWRRWSASTGRARSSVAPWAFAGALALCVPLMRKSFLTDETGTYWLVKDGAWEAIRRTIDYPLVSPVYTPVAWAAAAIGGTSEIALRTPSLLAIGLAAYRFYRLAADLFDRLTGVLAAVLFVYVPGVGLAAMARPYALAQLGVIGSTLLLVRWIDHPRWSIGAGYVLTVTGVVYLQPLYAPLLGVHLVLVWERGRAALVPLTGLYVAVSVLLFPLVARMWGMRDRATVSSAASVPPWSAVVSTLGLLAVLAVLLLSWRRRLPARAPVATLILWSLGPLLLLVVLSHVSGLGLVIYRYYAYLLPAPALTLAVLLARMDRGARAVALVGLAALFMAPPVTRGIGVVHENWKEGAERVRALGLPASTPVLFRSGFPEGRIWYNTPGRVEFLRAPIATYPIPGIVMVLPYDFEGAAAVQYLEREVIPPLQNEHDVVVFGYDYDAGRDRPVPLRAWFDGHLPDFTSTEVWRQESIVVLHYTRRHP